MSLSIPVETQEAIKGHAKTNNVSVSKLIRDMVDTYLLQAKRITVVRHEDGYVPVVLKVPAALKGDREGVIGWLRTRMLGIAERLAAMPPDPAVEPPDTVSH